MPTGEVLLPISMAARIECRIWMTLAAEVSVVQCDNLLTESDPSKLQFTILPPGPRGIRADVKKHWDNPALQRLLKVFDGVPYESAFNFQEMTTIALEDGRWLGVGRTFLGSPGFTVSTDRGWIVVGREIPGETRNAGLVFGKPRILVDVDDTGEINLKTGISMPQFCERDRARSINPHNCKQYHR
jgi:hypothetical protein